MTALPPKLKQHQDALLVFLLLWFSYGYFRHDPADNGNARLGLVFALVEEQRLAIDSFHDATGMKTIDKAFAGGHYYSDKAIGAAVVGTFFYWPIHAVMDVTGTALPLAQLKHLLTFLTIGFPSAIAGALCYQFCRELGASRWRAYIATVSVALGTLCFPYSSLFYGHQLAGAFILAALFLVFQLRNPHPPLKGRHLLLFGLLLGMALITEYPTALLVAPIIAYYFWVLRNDRPEVRTWSWRWFVWPSFGALMPLTLLGLYNYLCFGSPFALGYQHEAHESFRVPLSKGVMGVSWPSYEVLGCITFHPSHGLFWFSPVLLMSLVGIALVLWRKEPQASTGLAKYRPEALLCLFALVAYLLFNAGFYEWWGGYSIGPRHLIPMLPLLALPLCFVPRKWFALVIVSALVSVVQMIVVTASQPQAPDAVRYKLREMAFFDYIPVYHYSWTRLTEGVFATNVGEVLFGLSGFWSLLPLILVMAGFTSYFARADALEPA